MSQEKKPKAAPPGGKETEGATNDAAAFKAAAAVLRVCDSDFALLVKVSFFKGGGGETPEAPPDDLELYLSPDVTVKELKQEIETRRHVDPTAAQLLLCGANGEETPIYAGRILRLAPPPPSPETAVKPAASGATDTAAAVTSSISPASLHLRCRIQPPDPRLLALFAATSLGDVWERDELLQKMTTERPARCCPAGHPLQIPTVATDERGRRLPPTEDSQNRCARCHWWERAGSRTTSGNIELKLCGCKVPLCEYPDFALCTACLEHHDQQEGRPAEEDPPAKLLETALFIIRQRAGIATWFGGKGHDCGLPKIRVDTEYAPRELQVNDRMRDRRSRELSPLQTGHHSVVVHAGARLLVRLSDRLRALLPETEHAEYTVDRVVDGDGKGVALEEIVGLRRMFRKTKHWSRLQEALREEFPTYETERGTPPDAYETLRLVSYQVDEVVFERDAMVDNGDY